MLHLANPDTVTGGRILWPDVTVTASATASRKRWTTRREDNGIVLRAPHIFAGGGTSISELQNLYQLIGIADQRVLRVTRGE